MITVLLVVLGSLVGSLRSPSSEAEAVVLVTPLVGNPFSPDGPGEDLVNLQSEAELVRSDVVATLVAQREGIAQDTGELLADVAVDLPPNTQILRVGYSAADAATASERAQSFAVEYLRFRQGRAEALLAGRRTGVKGQIEDQSRSLRRLVSELQSTKNASRKALLRTRIDSSSSQIAQLRGQLAESSVRSLDPGQIVTPASEAAASTGPPLGVVGAVVGGALGVVLSVLMALRWWGPRRIRHADDLALMGLPVLAEVGEDWLLDPPADAFADEDLRELRAAVLAEVRADGTPALVLVSPLLAGHPYSAGALARVVAQTSVRTIFADVGETADALARIHSDSLDRGAVLREETTLQEQLVPAGPNLWLLKGEPIDLAATPALRRLLERCNGLAELVVLAGPPLSEPESRVLVDAADLVLAELDERARDDPATAGPVIEALTRSRTEAGTARIRALWVRSAPTHG